MIERIRASRFIADGAWTGAVLAVATPVICWLCLVYLPEHPW
jgi:hypothetical protein